jgi:hypothetical protein
VISAQNNEHAWQYGMRIFKNMKIPYESLIYNILGISPGQVLSGVENLNWWISFKRRRKDYEVYVEAKKVAGHVWAIISLYFNKYTQRQLPF